MKSALPILAEAADNVGDPAVQARGTIGGALAHSDPAADFTAIFLALDGSVDVTGTNGTRTIAADDLFVDLFTTALEADEIITSVSFPAADGAGMAYEKFRHPGLGLCRRWRGGESFQGRRRQRRIGADRRHRRHQQGNARDRGRAGAGRQGA